MNKIRFLTSILAGFLICSFLASAVYAAGDVAYIYRKNFKIDENVVNAFKELNLSVDLLNEKNLPVNFSKYRLIYAGDENFVKASQIKVNDFPSIVSNYYHAPLWGLTDSEGVSQLASNNPLSVIKDGRLIQVYTVADGLGRPSISYYFLDKENKAPSLQSIAFAETTSAGEEFGDVISYASPGARLANGKTQKSKLCYFGIVESDFWTPAAKQMFNDCVNFVAAACSTDSDCGAEEFSEPFCIGDNVYKTKTDSFCDKSQKINKCASAEANISVENCSFKCDNGRCLPGIHDIALIDFTNSINKIRLETENGTTILNNELQCSQKYQVQLTVKNKGNFSENVSIEGNAGEINFDYAVLNSIVPGNSSLKTKTVNFSLAEGFYNISVEASIAGFQDANPSDNFASRQVFVSCPVAEINCSSDAECGTNGFVGDLFCTDKNVTQLFERFKCNNSSTPDSFCTSTEEPVTKQVCPQICFNGACQAVKCFSDADCNDANPLTFDQCINPGKVVSECRNTPINCATDNDCGFTGFVGENSCSSNNVTKNFQTAICLNGGTLNSTCNIEVTARDIQICPFVCSQGTCIRCNTNSDCNDNNPATTDICHNPRTPSSSCSNDVIPPTEIVCRSNADCNSDSIINSGFCFGNNVSRLVLTWTCNNANTTLSFCSSDLKIETLTTCNEFCSDGNCVNIECFNNKDCNDNNASTIDLCNNAGTEDSFCTNNPIEVVCSSDADCGTDGFLGGKICVGKDVTRLSQNFQCFLPNIAQSFCFSSVEQKTITQCDFACSNGECITNFECTPNQTQQCGFNNVGECKLGMQTCSSNGFWLACNGAVFPSQEICDKKDNDCDGQVDEGNVCAECQDRTDNDGDYLIDFPEDPGCESPADTSESPPNPAQCADKIDNDGDGKIDFPADPDCTSKFDNTE